MLSGLVSSEFSLPDFWMATYLLGSHMPFLCACERGLGGLFLFFIWTQSYQIRVSPLFNLSVSFKTLFLSTVMLGWGVRVSTYEFRRYTIQSVTVCVCCIGSYCPWHLGIVFLSIVIMFIFLKGKLILD